MQMLIRILLLFMTCPLLASEWTVNPGDSISVVIQKAHPGDTVYVEKAFYHDHLLINKPLRLIGRHRPTLSGDNLGDVIRINAEKVTIEGFIIRDSGDSLENQNAAIYVTPGAHAARVRNNDLVYVLFGLWIEKANDVFVENNLIIGKRDYVSSQRGNGIELYNTQGARILRNRICFARDGIYVDVSHHALFQGNEMHHLRYGTHYMNSYYNTWEGNKTYKNRGGLALMEVRNQVVRNNVAWGNTDHGIMLRTIQDSIIENNVVGANDRGFFIYDAEFNTLKGNLVIGNRVGIHLAAGSTGNGVDGNDFIHNQDQIRYVASHDEQWGQKQGNYWSNYVGWDRDGDGVGDVPYEASDVVDHLLWKYPLARVLLDSPSVQVLRVVSHQFPLLRSPTVVDAHPRMRPWNPHWKNWDRPHD